MTQPRVVAVIPKNSKEEIRVSFETWKGHSLIDCRVFYEGDDGVRRATKKGLSVRREILPDLIQALRRAEREGR